MDNVTVTFTRAEYEALVRALGGHRAVRERGFSVPGLSTLYIADLQAAHDRLEAAGRVPLVTP
jgi:hypothetical protein